MYVSPLAAERSPFSKPTAHDSSLSLKYSCIDLILTDLVPLSQSESAGLGHEHYPATRLHLLAHPPVVRHDGGKFNNLLRPPLNKKSFPVDRPGGIILRLYPAAFFFFFFLD